MITQRSSEDRLALKWEFPGGKIELGETPETCLVREIREELCLEIMVDGHCATSIYAYETGEIELMAYFARVTGGDMKLSVHDDARWVTVDELASFDFAPADVPIVTRLEKMFSFP